MRVRGKELSGVYAEFKSAVEVGRTAGHWRPATPDDEVSMS